MVAASRSWEVFELLGPSTRAPIVTTVTLSGTAQQVDDGGAGHASAMSGRRKVRIYNIDSSIPVYVGFDAIVTNAGGLEVGCPIAAGQQDEFLVGETVGLGSQLEQGARVRRVDGGRRGELHVRRGGRRAVPAAAR